MARPIAIRNTSQYMPEAKIDAPGLEVVPKTFWSPPKGLDYHNLKNRVDVAHFVEGLNLYLDRGKLRSRLGTSQVGSAGDAPVMAVVNFVTSTGVGYIIRFLTTKMQILVGGVSWQDVAGAVFTGTTNNYFTYTAFGDTLIFSNGVDGMWEYAPLAGSLMVITDAPSALHLTTFNERVWASGADGEPGRVQWSASRDSLDWTGLGSGFEDLLSTPGGIVDAVTGVFPISDDVALMVRSNSIWQVTTTGDPDEPHRFSRLHSNLGSRSRHAIDVIPGGIIMLGTDDVWIVSDSSVQSIGELVKDRFFLEASDVRRARAIFRSRAREFWLTLGDTDVLYRYSLLDQGWSRHKYTFDIRWFDDSVYHSSGQTWDDTVGTWDSQTSSWNDLIGTQQSPAFYFATGESLGNVITENAAQETDVYVQAGKSAQGIEVQTPVLQSASPLEKTQIIEVQLEYEQGSVTQTVQIEYATDGGTVWNTYSSKALTITSGVYNRISRAMKTLERQQMQLRIRSTTLGRLIISSFSAFLVQGAKRAP